jgi:hypothetical protein
LQNRGCTQEDDTSELYSGNKQTIGQLLSLTREPIVVPEWQRGFSWDRTAVECLWLDLLAFSNRHAGESIEHRQYHLGSVALARQDSCFIVLLDGQHRLAIATILLSVIRDFVSLHDEQAASEIQRKYIEALDNRTGSVTYRLTLNRVDREFFQREVQERSCAGRRPSEPNIESHRLIWQTRILLSDRFETQCTYRGDGSQAVDWALRIRDVLTDHVSVVTLASSWTSTIQLPRARTAPVRSVVLQPQ